MKESLNDNLNGLYCVRPNYEAALATPESKMPANIFAAIPSLSSEED